MNHPRGTNRGKIKSERVAILTTEDEVFSRILQAFQCPADAFHCRKSARVEIRSMVDEDRVDPSRVPETLRELEELIEAEAMSGASSQAGSGLRGPVLVGAREAYSNVIHG
jgi:hypothetical protein